MWVVGHRNPDVDSICSAIALAYFLDGTPGRQGELNPETKFVLKRWGVKSPRKITSARRKKVFLVDHSEEYQSLRHLLEGKIMGVIDHHSISLELEYPVHYLEKPVGSTATIIAELHFRNNMDMVGGKNKKMPKKIAGLLLSAIISDTVAFKSPTTTRLDRAMATKLAKVARVNIKQLGKEIVSYKFMLGKISFGKVFKGNLKEYEFSGKKVSIGATSIFGKQDLSVYKKDVEKLLKKEIKRGFNLSIFLIVEWSYKRSHAFVKGNAKMFEKAFRVKLKNDECVLKNVLSRKLQVVPELEEAYKDA